MLLDEMLSLAKAEDVVALMKANDFVPNRYTDQAANKSTFVSLLGLKKAKQELNKQHDLAIQALHSLAYNTEKLEAFTDFMVTRTF